MKWYQADPYCSHNIILVILSSLHLVRCSTYRHFKADGAVTCVCWLEQATLFRKKRFGTK
ncbi:hypothetical protein BLGI_5000 [Brevibacillus laterosporus GI-9]|nr:hypothetical protein BLGI_5000 [Brevibacillus laterosporus GI-9]